MELKKANPTFPILIRECSGVQPKLWARSGENIVSVARRLTSVTTECQMQCLWPCIHLVLSCTCIADFGKESSVALDNMNADQVAKVLETVVTS